MDEKLKHLYYIANIYIGKLVADYRTFLYFTEI